MQGPHQEIYHPHGKHRIAQNAVLSVHPPDAQRDRTTPNCFDEQGQLKVVFWEGLGVFQTNHLPSNENIGTNMIYAGLQASRVSMEAIVRRRFLALICF
jgi:hypothetical protein